MYLRLIIFCLLLSSLHLHGEAQESTCAPEEKKEETKPNDSKGDKDEAKKDDEKKEEIAPPKIGNFALPTSQQPYGLFALGGNVIDKEEIQLYFFADLFRGKRRTISDCIPSALFGIRDDLSIWFNFPFSPRMRDDDHRSSGFEDFFVQLEYAFYDKKTYTYSDQATILGNITFATGSIHKNPPTGFGAPAFIIGATFDRTWVDWFAFTALQGVITTERHGTQAGEEYLYQFGFGKNIPSPAGWIYAWMIEFDGQYNKKNRIKGKIDPNSGGNTIYVTPSLWVSSKELLFQFGISFPVNQHLYGKQNKFDYVLNLNFAWSFY